MSGGKDSCGLSYASRSDDGHEPACKQFFADRADIFIPAHHSGEWRRQWICGLNSGNRPRQFLHRTPHYWGDKTISAAGHIREETRTIAVKRFTQRRNMDAKTDVFDKNVWPYLRDQLFLANDFARSVS
jgi:S-adenosylmethionine:diacylglycerol 3-amino-3-carboxypropyl transferase